MCADAVFDSSQGNHSLELTQIENTKPICDVPISPSQKT